MNSKTSTKSLSLKDKVVLYLNSELDKRLGSLGVGAGPERRGPFSSSSSEMARTWSSWPPIAAGPPTPAGSTI